MTGRAQPMNRVGTYKRETKKTNGDGTRDPAGPGRPAAPPGTGMPPPLVEQIARHGIFDITLKAKGDLQIDSHHTVEDVAIGLGRALLAALGDARGIVRMADATVPLDESLSQVALDLSGRGHAAISVAWADARIGELPSDLVEHFPPTPATEGKFNLHARVLAGVNDHHKAESLMKALARALCAATRIHPRRAGPTPTTPPPPPPPAAPAKRPARKRRWAEVDARCGSKPTAKRTGCRIHPAGAVVVSSTSNRDVSMIGFASRRSHIASTR